MNSLDQENGVSKYEIWPLLCDLSRWMHWFSLKGFGSLYFFKLPYNLTQKIDSGYYYIFAHLPCIFLTKLEIWDYSSICSGYCYLIISRFLSDNIFGSPMLTTTWYSLLGFKLYKYLTGLSLTVGEEVLWI